MRLRVAIRYLARRLALAALTVLGLATLVFIMLKLIPGDEAQMVAGPEASAAQVAAVRARLGLDQGVIVQYLHFLGRLAHGDLGTSTSTFQPVLSDLGQVLPSTIELVLVAMTINVLVAVPTALWAVARQGGLADGSFRFLAVLAGGLPTFWLALILQFVLASHYGLLPISGQQTMGFAAVPHTSMVTVDALLDGDWPGFIDALAHIVLPACALAAIFAAQIFRLLRASLLGVLESDYIMPVRAKGASFARMMWRHALPNGLSPALTLAGTQVGTMIGSAVLVEGIFARQGVGAYLANAIAYKDNFAVIGTVLFVGVVVCLSGLAVDLLQLLLDPRIRVGLDRA